MWLQELLPVALERLAEGFEAFEEFESGQTANGTSLETDGWGMWLRELLLQDLKRLKGLRAGKRQARTSLKTDA